MVDLYLEIANVGSVIYEIPDPNVIIDNYED